jgi:hypothetical protein
LRVSDATMIATSRNDPPLHPINTKKWYRKEADLWAELGDEVPFS